MKSVDLFPVSKGFCFELLHLIIMYKINIISAAFPNNTTSRDVYCKIIS